MSVLFLQTVRLPWVAAAWPWIRRAEQVWVFDPHTLGSRRRRGRLEGIARRVLRFAARGRVERVDRALRNHLGYLGREASDRYVETAMERVRRMRSYQITVRLIDHPAVDRMFCRLLLPQILLSSQFYRFAEWLLQNQKVENLVLVPADDDPWQTRQHFRLQGSRIPAAVQRLNRGQRVWRQTVALLLSGAVWPAVVLRHAARTFRFQHAPVAVVKTPVVIPLTWPLSEQRARKWDNESFLNGEGELNRDRVAFFYSSWRLSPQQRAEQERLMRERGIRWFDPAAFRADPEHRREVLELFGTLVWALVRHPSVFLEPLPVVWASGFIFSSLLRELLFNQCVRYDVRVDFADYEPNNVMRTIVANRWGRATVGLHHSANSLTYVFPEIRYLYMNRLCLWHEGFRKAFGHHWNPMECVPIGNHRLDFVLRAMQPERLGALRDHARFRWGLSGPLLLVTLPNHPEDVEYQNPARFLELYRGLLLCLEAFREVWIVLRPRNRQGWLHYLKEPMIQHLMAHPRVVVDQDELTTPEWIALADGVIGSSTSSVVVEAGTAGKKVFSFDTDGLGAVTFGTYGKDFVITRADQLLRVVRGILTGDPVLDCDWERFAREQTYFSDGRNVERLRSAIWDLAQQVQERGPLPIQEDALLEEAAHGV